MKNSDWLGATCIFKIDVGHSVCQYFLGHKQTLIDFLHDKYSLKEEKSQLKILKTTVFVVNALILCYVKDRIMHREVNGCGGGFLRKPG